MVQYDFQAIQKHIVDKFIHGKPRILSDLPEVVYRKDIYTSVTFEAVKRNVKHQVYTLDLLKPYLTTICFQISLDSRVRKEILSELHTADRLRECLDVVDIVVKFLSSGGVDPKKPLAVYLKKRLKMKEKLHYKVLFFSLILLN